MLDTKYWFINNIQKYSDAEIIRGCMDNDRKFQEILYKKYFRDCIYLCLRYTNDMDRAKMIVNDGLLKVFINISKYSGKGSLRAWIKRIVFNAMSDHFRKDSKYLKFILFEEVEKSESNEIIQDLYCDDIMKVVDELDDITREVFVNYAIEGYSHKEIGNLLDISEGNSKWHLHKARKILKKKLLVAAKVQNHAG